MRGKSDINREDIIDKIKRRQNYTEYNEYIVADTELKEKHKLLISIGLLAGLRDEEKIKRIFKKWRKCLSVEEIVDSTSPVILSRGIPSWFTITNALEKEIGDLLNREENPYKLIKNLESALEYSYRENGKEHNLKNWQILLLKYKPETLIDYSSLRSNLLVESEVPRKIKELILMNINFVDYYPQGIELHQNLARKFGASEDEILEALTISYLVAAEKIRL